MTKTVDLKLTEASFSAIIDAMSGQHNCYLAIMDYGDYLENRGILDASVNQEQEREEQEKTDEAANNMWQEKGLHLGDIEMLESYAYCWLGGDDNAEINIGSGLEILQELIGE